ncbi:hypothetical protein LCGC14_0569430 [marine sediment metagenome]|uniref:DNA methylase N-4/N-6 domain-containing protein n=1 Tax=marine sediment metagenome TaxID=412755 RepID=A0A0F9RPP1_9ZZZZ
MPTTLSEINDAYGAINFYEQKLKEARAARHKLLNRKKSNPKVIAQDSTSKWAAYHGDAVEVTKGIPDNSIHYSIFSPPFASLFTYSNSARDMGNSQDGNFYDHFAYLLPELYRAMMPGRLISIHCMDIPAMKERDGYIGLKDFPGMLLKEFERIGFIYHSKVHIKKNELLEAQRTRAIGLAHKQVVKDSAICRNALPDYIMTVRKPGNNPEPISRKNGFEIYRGSKSQPDKPKHKKHALNRFSQKIWQRYAASVWLDINQTDTLNVQAAREQNDERHICPLQLGVITRCLELWTNESDTVLDPFGGIMSVGYQALLMNRRAVMIELKESYYKQGIKNLKRASKPTTKRFF